MSALLEGLNDAQKQAVEHGTGPLLIVAGAGTGKTTVLTRRYVYLLQEKGLTTDQIVALTFTEKAAGEMEDRVIQLLPAGAYDFWIHTFHGFCQRLLEEHGLDIGVPNQFRLLSTTDAWLLLRRNLNELPLEYYKPLGNPTKFLRSLLAHISRLKDEGITPERYAAFVEERAMQAKTPEDEEELKRLRELAEAYRVYQYLLREEGAMDFGDLILEALRLLKTRPAILKAYRERFQMFLVDEFQDTNWAQYELVKLLLGETKNLTVVGDDDQAIYKFRGASLANILQFRDDFPEAKTVALTQNYRSKKEILDLAYHVIRKNDPNRLEVRLKDTGLSKVLEAVQGDGGVVRALWAESEFAEAEAVVQDIQKKKSKDPSTSWNEFAILVRSNDGAEPFVRACERAGIPFQFLALRGLYTKRVILDLVALLSAIDGYHESSAIWRVLQLAVYAIPQRDIAELLHETNRRGLPLWRIVVDAVRGGVPGLANETRAKLERLAMDIEELTELARTKSAMQMLQQVLEKTGYLAWLMKQSEREKTETLEHLNRFADRIRRYEAAMQDPHVRGFLEEFRLEVESGEEGALGSDPESGPEFVRIMTVHAAKGLEFAHVYIVSLVDQRFPTRARGEGIAVPQGLIEERLPEMDAHIEEERRLFYVAMTRAKQTLTLSGAKDYGGSREKKPSTFLQETDLPLESVNVKGSILAPEPVIDLENTEHPLTHYELKKRFSFTQLAAFRSCPLQYKFEHIYRIPKLGTFQKSFGQSVHLAFERILHLHIQRSAGEQASLFAAQTPKQPGFQVSREEAKEIFEDAWIDEWYDSRKRHDEYFALGKKAVAAFWKECNERVPNVLSVERPFTLLLGKHSLKGKIDRVDDLGDGMVAVLDYKTGTAKDELSPEDREQLYLYQVALEHQGLKVAKMAYIYVGEWVKRDVEPLSESKRAAFLEKIEERMAAILSSDFSPTPAPFTCRYCDFKQICEFKRLS